MDGSSIFSGSRGRSQELQDYACKQDGPNLDPNVNNDRTNVATAEFPITLDFGSSSPLTIELAAHLRTAILDGTLGRRLPAVLAHAGRRLRVSGRGCQGLRATLGGGVPRKPRSGRNAWCRSSQYPGPRPGGHRGKTAGSRKADAGPEPGAARGTPFLDNDGAPPGARRWPNP